MIAIVDNDVILKLARWDLLDSLVGLIGGEHRRIHHLSTCVPSLVGLEQVTDVDLAMV